MNKSLKVGEDEWRREREGNEIGGKEEGE